MSAYRLHVCVDFFDDLLSGPFDHERLTALFGLFRQAGMRRIYWIYTHRYDAGYLRCCPFARICENAAATYNALGEFLPAAVKAAHGLGIEIYAVYKPFDLAHNDSFPFGSEEGQRYGIGLQSLSGELFWGLRTLKPYADMRMTRRTDDLPPDLDQRVVRQIRLIGQDDSPTRLRPEHVRLTVSRDNGHYEPYPGPIAFHDRIESGRRVVTLDGLRIAEPYFALHTPFCDSHATLRNTVHALGELRDESGQSVPFTFGLVSRADRYRPGLEADGQLNEWHQAPRDGYQFNMPDFHATERPLVAVDNSRGYLAFARGKERYVAGALSPAFDAVHDLWLTHIGECLDAGVDGVDLREAQHNRALVWSDYGFEAPVIDAYRRLYGESDPARFDREKQEQIIADRYTDFYRKAASMIRSRGKRVQLHVNLLGRRYMGMKWDWPRWIAEGLADEITLKNVWPGDREYLDVIVPHTLSRGIPVYSCPYLVEPKGITSLEATLATRLRDAAADGRESGFILYESAAVASIAPDMRPTIHSPEILNALSAADVAGGTIG